ncbi:hypothetical protein QBC37DRAFT_136580 [Rhypophila decipiens]|uniref:DUF7580 domain-containing protein n=1 Tax=Rhypophila decipiens TaxID=261697 RepID=A0AAN6YHN7_9PEZI|nr:hypothetical protein QBC37DRAFT_136580 [Rhypophila decipiens]
MTKTLPSVGASRVVFHLDPADQTALHDYKIEDLETYIRMTPRRDARIRLGLSIVLNMLNLGKTPLIPSLWRKDDVFIYRHSTDGSISQPYLKSPELPQSASPHLSNNTRISNQTTPPVSDTKQARQRLFTLGVLLLELLFSNTLVDKLSQPDYTNTVLLCTALTWQRRVEEEFGDGIAEAIRKCIVCAFEPAADLGSAAFILAVWSNVVQPLEEFLRAWGGVGTAVG